MGVSKAHRWELLHEGDFLAGPGNMNIPTKRYGHAMASVDDGAYVSHGYHFDHARAKPTWLNDLWFFSFSTFAWRRISVGGPSPRFKHTLGLYRDRLVLFGGEDGGHQTSKTNVWGSFFNDIWTFDLKNNHWTKLEPAGLLVPQARTAHCAVIFEDSLYIFGGLTAVERSTKDSRFLRDSDDFWKFSFVSLQWTRVVVLGRSPTGRYSHSCILSTSVARSTPKIWLFGGYARTSSPRSSNELWSFDLETQNWKLHATGASAVRPDPRGAHTAVGGDGFIVVFSGAFCDVACNSLHDTWRYNMSSDLWQILLTSTENREEPIARHDLTSVHDNRRGIDAMVIFGGESNNPYAYWNDVWRLRLDNTNPTPDLVGLALYHAQAALPKSLMLRTRDEEQQISATRELYSSQVFSEYIGLQLVVVLAMLLLVYIKHRLAR